MKKLLITMTVTLLCAIAFGQGKLLVSSAESMGKFTRLWEPS